MAERLYRSRSDRVLTGVAGGLAERLDVDPSIVRVAWVVLTVLSGGIVALIYVVMAVVVPEGGSGEPHTPAGSSPPLPGSPSSTPRAPNRPGDNNAALVLGALLIVLGAFFLVRQFLPRIDVGALWPVLAIAAGVLLVILSVAPRGPRR